MRAIANQFYTHKYPNNVGAIDGSLITVTDTEKHRLDYSTS